MRRRRLAINCIARLGYAARGVVYLTVGFLATYAALEFEGPEDVSGALHAINNQPYGRFITLGLGVGLLAYALWRTIQALLDADEHGWEFKAIILRLSFLVSAALYTSIALACIQIARNLGSGGGSHMQEMVATLLRWPAGAWLVFGVALVLCIAGIVHIHKGLTGGFEKWFEASDRAMRFIDPVSRVGLTVRGLIFVALSGFVMYASFTLDSSDAMGLKGLLLWIQGRSYGRFLLGAIGVGLLAFGAYGVMEAFVRRVGLSDNRRDDCAA